MVSKLFQIGIFLFWVVMSTQLVRYLYFQREDNFREVSTKLVMENFLAQDEGAVKYNMYQYGKKLGTASISIRELKPNLHSLTLNGRVEENPNLANTRVKYNWDSTLILQNTDILQSVRLVIRLAEQGIRAEINSVTDSNELNYEVRHGDMVLFTSKKTAVNQLLSFAMGGGDVNQIMAASVLSSLGIKVPDKKELAASASNTVIKGRSGTRFAGGQNREVYILKFEPIGGQIVEMTFNHAGQLMLVTVPSGIELRSIEWFPE